MKKLLLIIVVFFLAAGTAMAGKYDLRLANTFNPAKFEDLVTEVGMLAAYRGIAPGEPQGITGFDVGGSISFIKLDDDVWDQALKGEDVPSYLPVPRLQVRKGLPFNLDVGASYAMIPQSDIQLLGAEVQLALLEGTTATPALSLRGSYSTLQGVDDLDLTTYGADAVISKGVLLFTPYAGIGLVRIEGEYAGKEADLVPGGAKELSDQEVTETRIFGGVQIALALLRITLDVEYSQLPVYTAKLSLGW